MIWAVVHAVVVCGLLGLAAGVAERGIRAVARGTRFVWLGAIVLSLLLPLAARARGGVTLPGLPPAMASLAAAPVRAPSWGLVVLVGWGTASVGLLMLAAFSGLRLRAQRRSWRATLVDGVPVLVSDGHGPAVVGLVAPRIVVPGWALDLPPEERRLLLLHELEHVRAGDVRLLAAGFGALVLLPWNPALWWCVQRLRLAVEADCDARVLRGGVDTRAYVDVLLRTAALQRTAAILGLAAGSSRLSRRLLRVVPGRPRFPRVSRAGAWALALGLFTIALLVPARLRSEPPLPELPGRPFGSAAAGAAGGGLPSAMAIDRRTGDTLAIVTVRGCTAADPRFCRGTVATGAVAAGRMDARSAYLRAQLRSARISAGAVRDTL